jgi:hypothetical protein
MNGHIHHFIKLIIEKNRNTKLGECVNVIIFKNCTNIYKIILKQKMYFNKNLSFKTFMQLKCSQFKIVLNKIVLGVFCKRNIYKTLKYYHSKGPKS